MQNRHDLGGRTRTARGAATAPRPGALTPLLAAGLLGILALATSSTAQPNATTSTSPRIVFDYTSIELTLPPLADPAPATSIALATHVLEPLIDEGAAPRVLRLPVAWRTEPSARTEPAGTDAPAPPTTEQVVVLDEATSLALQRALPPGDVTNQLSGRIRSRALQAGRDIPLVAAEAEPRILERERLPTDVARGGTAAWMRVLTRGEVHDRWTIREELLDKPTESEDGADPTATPTGAVSVLDPLVPERLLQVDVVAAGLHEERSGYPLPGSFVHFALRVRLWHVRSGRREWDRQVILGSTLALPHADGQSDGPLMGSSEWQQAVRDAAWGLLDAAAELLVADLAGGPAPAIEALGAAPQPGAAAGTESASEVPVEGAGVPAAALAFPDQLRKLAEIRLQGGPGGDAWRSLRQAVEPGLPAHLGIALACAEDPDAALAGLAARQMGIGLAEAHHVVQESDALRRVLATELTREASAPDASGEAGPAAAITAHVLAGRSTGEPRAAPDVATTAAARALLAAALADRASSPQALAGLLLAGKVLPDEASATIAVLLQEAVPSP